MILLFSKLLPKEYIRINIDTHSYIYMYSHIHIFIYTYIYFGHLMWRADSLEETLMLGKIEGKRKRRQQADKRMRWLDGIINSMDSTLSKLGDSGGQGSLECCSPWGCKELNTTEQLNNNSKRIHSRDFPGSPVVKIPCFQCRGHRYDHWSRS